MTIDTKKSARMYAIRKGRKEILFKTGQLLLPMGKMGVRANWDVLSLSRRLGVLNCRDRGRGM